MNKSKFRISILGLVVAIVSSFLLQTSAFAQGSLTPPGAPEPTFKTLQQVEPRTPITNLPYTISVPGSYYLTTNLTGNPGGITIATNGVSLDLMGFELVGGTGVGINLTVAPKNITVMNGVIRNWGSGGLSASLQGSGCLFERLHASNNGGTGLSVPIATDVIIKRCTASANAGAGIETGPGSLVTECTASRNGGYGINAPLAGSLVTECIVSSNGFSGIVTGEGSTIRDCVARTMVDSDSLALTRGAAARSSAALFPATQSLPLLTQRP